MADAKQRPAGMTLAQVMSNPARAEAYERAKTAGPYRWQQFQGDGEIRKVRYTPRVGGILFEGEEVGATPGYWYEVAVKDTTTMAPQSSVGFRVYDVDVAQEDAA